jgi:hypothetical protein
VSVGNPHAVVRHDPARHRRLGRSSRRIARFPERTNVQLVRVDGDARPDVASGSAERGRRRLRVERDRGGRRGDRQRLVHEPGDGAHAGGDLYVELDGDEARLTGPAVELA